jgi:hypothetical protein
MSKLKYMFGFLLLLVNGSCTEDKIQESGYGVVKGRVVKAVTFEPIANVKVSSNPSSSAVFTDALGYFEIKEVVTGDYSFEARKNGYLAKFEAVKVHSGTTTEMVFELEIDKTDNLPPEIPILTSPVDNAVEQPINVDLTWSSSDIDNDILTYQLILRNDSNSEILTYSAITSPHFNLTNLNYSTKYYWQLSVSDGINAPVFSKTSSFKTQQFPSARFLFVKKIGNNNVIFAGDDKGNKLQLTSSQTNSFRPRKNNVYGKIAFIRTDGAQGHIYTMNPDGSDVVKVTSTIPITGFNNDYINFSWSANGSQIIYPYFDKLYQINRDGSGLTLIYKTPNGKFISECDWSTNGSTIALKTNDSNGYQVELFLISSSGVVLNTVLSGVNGAAGGLQLSVDNQKLLFTRDFSGYESGDYRQLDTRIYMHDFITNLTSEIAVQRPNGTNDIDVRFSPNEAELIFMNTSNDGISAKNVVKYSLGTSSSRTVLFTDSAMPDWK